MVTRRNFLTWIPGLLGTAAMSNLPSVALSNTNRRFKPIFDGKTLNGWHTNTTRIGHGTGGSWLVENGILTGEQDPPGSGNGGVLLTDELYGDFELLVDLAPDWGVDSGVFLRTNNQGECFQVYVDYHNQGQVGFISTERAKGKGRMYIRPFYIDGILDEKGNPTGFTTAPDKRSEAWGPGFLDYHCSPEQWKKAWRIGAWNTLRIRCTGKYPQITTWINGTLIAKFNGETSKSPIYDKEDLLDSLGSEGAIGLQVHGGKGWPNGAKCRWRNIRVKQL